jgi:cysteinyl-tRNA synthetase
MEIKKSLGNFYRFFDRYQRITGNSFYFLPFYNNQIVTNQDFVECRNKFLEFLADDFNTSGALGVLHEILAIVNRYAEIGKLESSPDKEMLATFEQGCKILRELSNILGIFQNESSNENVTDDDIVGPLIDLLIEMRNEARKSKNFTLADRIRDRLSELRIIIEDRSSSSGWRRE